MKIVIALDSFKGGLDAAAACQTVAAGLRQIDSEVECVLKPMADGGEGTAAALLAARPVGQWISMRVAGPLPQRTVDAGFAWFADDAVAVVEMATANGLPLLAEHERNPLLTSTYGTGQLLKAAAEHGARHILLALGGSATVDGGIGAATALGWRFYDADDADVDATGAGLNAIARIIPPPNNVLPPVTVLSDVTNPLCGSHGAAAVFAPQKGATAEMVVILERGLANLAARIKSDLGRDVIDLPGGGAAGGFGAGAAAFFAAELAPGIATIIEAAGLHDALVGADWCITGEGSFDNQSLHGKVVSGVATAAQARGVPVAVFAGRVKATPAQYRAHGICDAVATHAPEMPMPEVMRREAELLQTTAAQWLQAKKGLGA